MTDEAMLTELQGLLERATAAPWSWERGYLGSCVLYAGRTMTWHGLNLLGRMDPDGNGEANLNLIAALRNAAPRLMELAQCAREAKRILDALRAAYALHEDDNEVAAEACKWLDRWEAKP